MRNQNSIARTQKFTGQNTKRLLIIEQSESLGILYKSILLQHKYTILTATCGEEALASLDSVQPDLIITAEELSDMTSDQLRRRVSIQSSEMYIPILVLSTQKKPLFRLARPALNVNETLFLPFRIKDLRNSVQRLLGTEQVSGSNFYDPSSSESSYIHPKKLRTA